MTTATVPKFVFRPAKREAIGLLVGVAGPTGSGKTFSALRLASGLAGGERFALIDTENGRALHYADGFQFDHGLLEPPFRPERYADAIKAADACGYPVIVVDSVSHEHAGEGGLLDWHEQELDRMAGNDWKRREAASMAAWVKPKLAHKLFVSQLLQVKAHLVLCFRAQEAVEMVREGGKTIIRPKRSPVGLDGWMPIAEKNLAYELTLSVLVTADQPGFPKPIKLQEQHRLLTPLDQPLSEETGAALAEWARGTDGDLHADAVQVASTELLELMEQLGRREEITALVQRNRRQHVGNLEKHLAWLETQLEKAQAAVDAQGDRPDEQISFGAEGTDAA